MDRQRGTHKACCRCGRDVQLISYCYFSFCQWLYLSPASVRWRRLFAGAVVQLCFRCIICCREIHGNRVGHRGIRVCRDTQNDAPLETAVYFRLLLTIGSKIWYEEKGFGLTNLYTCHSHQSVSRHTRMPRHSVRYL